MTDTTFPRGLEGSCYTDPDVFAQELEHIFAKTWQMVGHQSQVGQPGQILTARIGDEGVIVANDNGTVKAFYNVCQHRGHELIPTDASGTEPVGSLTTATTGALSSGAALTSITCPYHAWSYDLGGNLLHARGEKVGEICVPQVRVESMAGFLFVNLDPDAPSLADTIPGVEDQLLAIAPDASERVFSYRRTHEVAANWKIAVENYNECYHCPNVHKAFSAGVVTPASYRIHPYGNTIHHTAEAPAPDKVAYQRADAADANDYGSFFTWPVSSIQCYPGRVLNTFRWVPLDVDRTLLVREWWFANATPTAEQMDIIELDWDTTVSEDFELMDSVQRGVSSRGYRPGPLINDPSGVATVHSENSVPHLHSLWREALALPAPVDG